MSYEFKIGIRKQMCDVRFPSGEKIVDTDDIMALLEKNFTEVAAKESGAASNEYAFHRSTSLFGMVAGPSFSNMTVNSSIPKLAILRQPLSDAVKSESGSPEILE